MEEGMKKDNMFGQVIQDYKLDYLLGEGGMAKVYRAKHLTLNIYFAIKFLKQEFVGNLEVRSRFVKEARDMANMSHINIVRVSNLIDAGDIVAFVMDYIEGEPLKEKIEREGKLDEDTILLLFNQMLDAVDYVHQKRLVHRDIKPSNFMLDKNGKVMLMDFGIAKKLDNPNGDFTTANYIQIGTLPYMSPEQILNSREVTPSSDIYSLGVVLWEMVSGKPHYSNLTYPEIQYKILKELLRFTETKWDKIIQKSTEKEIDKRYRNCFEFKQDIQFKSTNQPIITSPNPTIKDAKKTSTQFKFFILTIITIGFGYLFFLLINNLNGKIPVKVELNDKPIPVKVESEPKQPKQNTPANAETAKKAQEKISDEHNKNPISVKEELKQNTPANAETARKAQEKGNFKKNKK